MEHSGFPSHETLAAFIDGRLDKQTRKRVMEHMATCGECRSTFVSLGEFHDQSVAASAPRYRLRWAYALAATFLLALVFFVGPLVPHRGRRQRLPEGVDSLIATTKSLHRPTAARISGFPHRPEVPIVRDGPPVDDGSDWGPKGEAGKILERAKANPTPENLHALGISYLSFDSPEPAVEQLEKAVRKETGKADVSAAIEASRDAQLLSDLSAAYFALAQKTEPRHDRLLSAVDAANKARALDPRSPEVAWNRAVSLEALNMRDAAMKAWDDYLRLDPSSEWAAEAKARRARLAVPTRSELWDQELKKLDGNAPDAIPVAARLAREFPQDARTLAQETLLPSWADAVLAGDAAGAARRLEIIRAIGEASAARGDTLLTRTVAHIEAKRDRRVAEGFVAWRAGRAAYKESQMDVAADAYRRALDRFSAGGSPFAPAAQHMAASADFNLNQYDAVLDRLGSIPAGDLAASPWLRGKVLWVTGLTQTMLGHQKQALDDYQQALDAFVKLGEEENQLAMQNLLAINDGYAADRVRAWERRFAALEQLRRLGRSGRAAYVLTDASRTAAAEGHRGAALVFADEMIRVAKRGKVPAAISDAYLNRGLALHLSGDDGGARAELRNAEHWADKIPTDEMRARTVANIELTAYDWRGEDSPDVALRRLDRVIDFAEGTARQYNLARIYFLRARTACAAGRAAQCELDLKKGLSEASEELGELSDPVLFGTYLTTMREATDGMASLLVKRGDARATLPYIDCKRLFFSAADARPVACADAATPLTGAVQRRLPRGAALLELAVIDGRLLCWLVTPERVRFEAGPLAARAALLERAVQELRGVQSLVIVSDPALADVSFPSLRNPATGRHLIEDIALSFQPSAATFAASPRPAPPRGGTLVVCNAAYDRKAVPGLAALPQATEEAKEVAGEYRAAQILSGSEATPERFLSDAGEAGIVHYVGHAISPRDAPLLAALVLAPAGRDRGLLFARDIARTKFPRTALVVLSACGAAAAARNEEAGVTNLARAFLAAGVPGVIASTTPVDDASAPEMFRLLHGLLARGVPPAVALQQAQIEMIRRGAPPVAWSGFQYLGSI
jgi:tetratricopeptide (TPR) repeat protein